jgi:hypothetical protein
VSRMLVWEAEEHGAPKTSSRLLQPA